MVKILAGNMIDGSELAWESTSYFLKKNIKKEAVFMELRVSETHRISKKRPRCGR